MKKKILTVLFVAVVTASSVLGGCGAPQETGGRAEGTEENEPERLVRPDYLRLAFWTECEYDKSGNQTKAVKYNTDGSVSEWYEYEYDMSGNQTKEVEYNSDGNAMAWVEYEYDKSGNQTKEVHEEVGGYGMMSLDGPVTDILYNRWHIEKEYDGSGHLTKAVRYEDNGNSQGSVWSWAEYEYDKSGNQTKEVWHSSDGSVLEWYEYEYDKSGNIIKTSCYKIIY